MRGVAGTELSPELVLALGRAAARVLDTRQFVVGMDSRRSGPMLASALMAGMTAEGVEAVSLGVIPTAGVAWISAADRVPGAVVSASHNPFPDNGVKLFAPGGRKLTDTEQAQVENELDRVLQDRGPGRAGDEVGSWVVSVGDSRYADSLVASIEGRDLAGLSVVLDCANGAASAVAPDVFQALGARLTVFNATPDGFNINDGCGSTHPEGLQRAVIEHGADVGLAFDGDADRVVAVDDRGRLVDGDQIMAICALDRHGRGRLAGDTLVITVMSNLGLRQALAANGLKWHETDVGDRAVLESLERGGWSLGGEQSGHVVFPDLATTGDGLLTGIQLLDVVVRSGRALSELAEVMTRHPQVLRNVRVRRRSDLNGHLSDDGPVAEALAAVRAELGEQGRVLIRPSGTEPVMRVMVEALTAAQAEEACDLLCRALERSVGAPSTS